MRKETEALHTGVDKDETFNSITTPIYMSSSFRFGAVGELPRFHYTRAGNPTRAALEENLVALENGRYAWVTGTGMAAITAVAFLLESGDHILAPRDIYGGTYRLFQNIMPRFDLSVSFVDMRDLEAVRRATRKETALVWIETPSNPLLQITDIRGVVEIASETGALTAADNTFLSPYFQQPLDLGVDLVVHSTTKYLNGHSDVVGGALITARDDLSAKLDLIVAGLGLSGSPFDSWLVLRGVKTLATRMEAHQKNASAVAHFLENHERVRRVYFPGLKSHPGHELALTQQSGFGGVVSFDLDLDAIRAEDFFASLRYFALAESLGGVESLAAQPWTMSHKTMPPSAREACGLGPGTVRLSVGIEHPDDLLEDLERAIEA
ncbi:MAG TPA: PLP-dependent aspartate aminotransferase family protein [Thermoleophilia bacterium]|nr:PLP-dependent aspartate aminotransferase family protein [Thermoleophilia bacterium]